MSGVNDLWHVFHSAEEIVLGLLLDYPFWVLAGLSAIIFLESSVAPFLPGDTLLFASGAALRTSPLSVHAAVWLFLAASSLGMAMNYGIGRRLRTRIRERGIWGIGTEQLRRTEALVGRYGVRMLVIGRFLPGVRTAVPLLAGAGTMPFRPFALYTVLGGIPWVFTFTYAGYYFGGIPGVEAYLVPVALLFVAIGVLPVFVTWVRSVWRGSPSND